MSASFATIPAELRALPQWVLWREEQRDPKPTKVPFTVTGSMASTTDPRTWNTFEAVTKTLASGRFDGIGFVFTEEDPFTGIDLDSVRDRTTGDLTDEAQTIVGRLASYTEVSPSETGVHVFVRGRKAGVRCRVGKFEMYDDDRFFCMTGAHLAGTPETIEERQEQLDSFYQVLFPPTTRDTNGFRLPQSVGMSDSDLYSKMVASKNGPKIEQLWRGETSAYPSHSEADAALCAYLAWWTDRDAARVDALFRQSGLMREKWDSPRGDTTYGAQTIEGAIAITAEGYVGPNNVTPIDRPRHRLHSAGPQTADDDESLPATDSGPKRTIPKLYTLEELQTFVGAAEDFIVGGGLLTRGGKLMLVAKAGKGKTTMLDYLAVSIASGRPFLGSFTIDRPRKVLFIQAELSESELATHGHNLWDQYGETEAARNLVFHLHAQMKLPRMAAELIQTVSEVRAEVVMFDPFIRFFEGENSDKPEQVDKVFAVFDRILELPSVVGIVVAHHENVAGKRTAGSWEFEGWPSTILRLETVEGVPSDRYVFFEKIRAPGQSYPEKQQFRLGDEGYLPVDPPTTLTEVDAGIETVCLVLRDDRGQASRQRIVRVLHDKYRVNGRTATTYIGKARQAGRIEGVKAGRETIYRLTDPKARVDEMAVAALNLTGD